MKKHRYILFSLLFFLSGFLIFSLFIFISSPYRVLRPYEIFGKKLISGLDTQLHDDRISVLIPDPSDPFYIDQIPVTIGDYKKCLVTGSCTEAHYTENYTNFYNSKISDSFPVSFVTWEEARAFCLSKGGDLPTAAQWSSAADLNGENEYAWGSSLPTISKANLDGYYQWLTPAGWLPDGANEYGILDLNGNVREWIMDDDGIYSTEKGLMSSSFQDDFSSGKNSRLVFHWQYSAGFNRGFRCVYPVK